MWKHLKNNYIDGLYSWPLSLVMLSLSLRHQSLVARVAEKMEHMYGHIDNIWKQDYFLQASTSEINIALFGINIVCHQFCLNCANRRVMSAMNHTSNDTSHEFWCCEDTNFILIAHWIFGADNVGKCVHVTRLETSVKHLFCNEACVTMAYSW